jgi:hypothetical protein
MVASAMGIKVPAVFEGLSNNGDVFSVSQPIKVLRKSLLVTTGRLANLLRSPS